MSLSNSRPGREAAATTETLVFWRVHSHICLTRLGLLLEDLLYSKSGLLKGEAQYAKRTIHSRAAAFTDDDIVCMAWQTYRM